MFTFPVGFFNLIASGGGGGETTDPFAANVVLFLKGNGTNGSTNIVDSSPTPKTISVFGNAQISTAQSKYGGSSLLFDGSGDYLSIPATGDMLFSTQNFTWEAWIYPTTLSAPYRITLMGNARANAGGDFGMHLQVKKNATNQTMFSAWGNENGSIGSSLNLNQWNHIACTRVGTTVEIFVNGIKGTTGSCATSITSHTAFLIGTVFDNGGFASDYTGYIDSLRLTAAVRYTANFNPETDTYLDISTNPTPTDTLASIFGADLVVNYSAKSVVRSVVGGEDRVSQWTDRSGNGHHATQSNSSLCPIYDATGFNNLPVVKMLNTRWMNMPNCLSNSWGQATMFIVYNLTDVSQHFVAMQTGTNDGQEAYWAANAVFGYAGYIAEFRTSRLTSQPTGANTLNIAGQALVEIISGTGTNGYLVNRNTINRLTTSPSFGVTPTPLIGRTTMGTIYTNYMNGDIAEIAIIKRTPTSDELSRVRQYFKNEWNLTIY